MDDEEAKEVIMDDTVNTKVDAEVLEPLIVKVVKEKKEFDELEHDDDEYQDMGITKEQLKEFEDGDSPS